MFAQSKLLAALELKNLYGLNTLLHTKDKSAKRRAVLMGVLWVVLIAMVFLYVGGLAFGLVYLGLGSIVPVYLVTISALFIFVFGMFKAGGVLFNRSGYDILCSLPLNAAAIVIARFVRLYVENLIVAAAVLLPGGAVYAFLTRPGAVFYLMWIVSTLLVPLIPVSLASVFGTVITALSSRMRNKAAAESVLTIGLVVVIMLGSSKMGAMSEELTPEMLGALADTAARILGSIYPPALWLGRAMAEGSVLALLLCAAVSALAFAAVTALAACNFHAICRRLNVTSAKHDYRMEQLQKTSALMALCRRELKRYFSSGIYVTNTIIGPVMGVLMAGAALFVGMDAIESTLGVVVDVDILLPFVVGGVFAMMPTTAVSVSMEGRSWWIVKSLPLATKTILDAKLLANLGLLLPFYVTAEILLVLALRPSGAAILRLVVLPALIILFSCVFGLAINLLLPKFDWDSEIYVVKQSAAAGVGGLGGMLMTVVSAVAVMLLPAAYRATGVLAVAALLLISTALLYRMCIRKDLKSL